MKIQSKRAHRKRKAQLHTSLSFNSLFVRRSFISLCINSARFCSLLMHLLSILKQKKKSVKSKMYADTRHTPVITIAKWKNSWALTDSRKSGKSTLWNYSRCGYANAVTNLLESNISPANAFLLQINTIVFHPAHDHTDDSPNVSRCFVIHFHVNQLMFHAHA